MTLPVLAFLALILASVPAPSATGTGEILFDAGTLHHLELTLNDHDWWQTLLESKASGALMTGSMCFDGQTFPDIGIRFHGNSSFSPHRHSKKVPFWISLGHRHPKQRLDGRATLILKNNFLDPSYLREVLALHLLSDYLPTPRANFVLVSINGESWGVYVNIELPDREFIERHFFDFSGPIHIGERAFSAESLREHPCQKVFPQVNTGADDACPEIEQVLAMVDGSDVKDRHSRLPNELDVDNTLRHMAAETMLGHMDGFPLHNYTLYLDPEDDRFTTIPWDFNMAFRVGAMRLMRPRGILSNPVWYARYRGYVRTMIERSLAPKRIERWIAVRHQLIGEALEADDKKLYPLEGFVPYTTTPSRPPPIGAPAPGLMAVIEGRNTWLAQSPIGRAPRVPLAFIEPSTEVVEGLEGTNSVHLRVRAEGKNAVERIIGHVEIDHLYHEHEMRDDGTQGDETKGDRIFTGIVVLPKADAILTYYFSAEATGGDINFLPYSGGFRPFRVGADRPTLEVQHRTPTPGPKYP